jgi:pilus assembly protein Flp/PilA
VSAQSAASSEARKQSSPNAHGKVRFEPKNWESVVMKTVITRFAKDESGVTAIEYGLIAAIVGVGIIVGLTTLKTGLNTLFTTVNTSLTK